RCILFWGIGSDFLVFKIVYLFRIFALPIISIYFSFIMCLTMVCLSSYGLLPLGHLCQK
ncbi:hypothetical protein GIB67_023084, partial [Kingdonia uniflora]